MKKEMKKIQLPSWLVLAVMVPLYETFLYFGTAEEVIWKRYVAIAFFAMGIGVTLGLLLSFLPRKVQKWTTLVIVALMALLYIVQYFIYDAYQGFMTFEGILNGAEGVASDYLDVVLGLIGRNLWKILLLFLPAILYGCFVEVPACKWKHRIALLLIGAMLFADAVGLVHIFKVDSMRFSLDTPFNYAVQSFGLNMGLGMNFLQANTEEQLSFNEVEYVPPTTPPTEPPVETEPPVATEVPEDVTEAPTEAPTEPPKVYHPHSLGLDFATMAQTEKNQNIANIHSYMATLTPAMENDYTGLFEGKNLIFVTAEAFSAYVVDEVRTPTLYRMMTEGIYFTDYYQPTWGAGTTGGEYSNLLSLIPYNSTESMEEVVQQDIFQAIGKQLQKQGYSSAAFHNNSHTFYNRHKTHTYLGYDIFMGEGNGMEEGITHMWPQSDEEMFRFTIPQYIDRQPFSLYYMTVSGHSTYLFSSHATARKNEAYVADLDKSQPVKAYLASQMELEHSMTYLLEQLEEKGIMDDTVVVIASDHYPYGLAPSDTWGMNSNYLSELMGQPPSDSFIRDKSTLIIWSGCLEDMDLVVNEPTMSLDILPTLSNLFGVEYDSRLMCGRDVLSDQMAIALWTDGSWKTTQGSYNGYNSQFTPAEGVEVDENYIKSMNAYIRNKWTYSKAVTYYNYFDYINAELERMRAPEPTEAPTEGG